jgi:four helix bundle protein
MGSADLRERTKLFALAVIRFYVGLPKTTEAQILGKQVLRSATSIGAQYREAQRAKSDADFISKIEGALQEAEETLYWLELLAESNITSQAVTQPLSVEVNEIIAIFVTIVNKVKQRPSKPGR